MLNREGKTNVVPVSLTGLKCSALEAKGTLPSTGFGGVL